MEIYILCSSKTRDSTKIASLSVLHTIKSTVFDHIEIKKLQAVVHFFQCSNFDDNDKY